MHGTMRCSPEALHSLLRLQQNLVLPSLSVGGPGLTNGAGPILAQMTDLQELSILHSPDFSFEGLQHLTSLQQLTCLRTAQCSCHKLSFDYDGEPKLCLINTNGVSACHY